MASVIIENKTPDRITFGFYDAAGDWTFKKEDVGGNVTTTVAVPNSGPCVIGAWRADPPAGLYPDDMNPFTTGGAIDEGGTYRVVLDTGGITFGTEG